MSKFLLISAFIFSTQVMAQEMAVSVADSSTFSMDKSTVEIQLKNRAADFHVSPYYKGTNNANIFKLNFYNELSDMTSFSVGTNFMKRDFQTSTDQSSNSATGLGDLELGIQSKIEYVPANLVYGVNSTLSLATARDPGPNTNGNNFSGYHTLAPFVGVESYVGKIATGGRVSYKYMTDPVVEGHDFEAAHELNLNGFVEVPFYKFLDIGISAGIGKNTHALGNGGFFDDPSNAYRGGIYANVKVDKESTITVDFASRNEKVPYEQNSTDLTVGLKKTL